MKPAKGNSAMESIQLIVETGVRFCITIQIDKMAIYALQASETPVFHSELSSGSVKVCFLR